MSLILFLFLSLPFSSNIRTGTQKQLLVQWLFLHMLLSFPPTRVYLRTRTPQLLNGERLWMAVTIFTDENTRFGRWEIGRKDWKERFKVKTSYTHCSEELLKKQKPHNKIWASFSAPGNLPQRCAASGLHIRHTRPACLLAVPQIYLILSLLWPSY